MKPARKVKLEDDKVLKWVDEQEKEVLTPYKNEILDFVRDSTVGLKGSEGWWRKWRRRNSELSSGKMPQFMETSRADARLSREEWEEVFQTHVKGALEEVGYEPHRVFNFDETGFFRNFLATYGGRKVWCRK